MKYCTIPSHDTAENNMHCKKKKVPYKTTKEIGNAETKVTHKSLNPEHTPHSLLHHSTVSYCPLVLYPSASYQDNRKLYNINKKVQWIKFEIQV